MFTFEDGTVFYVGGSIPQKFILIVSAPNNPPYFIKKPQSFIIVDLKTLNNNSISMPLP